MGHEAQHRGEAHCISTTTLRRPEPKLADINESIFNCIQQAYILKLSEILSLWHVPRTAPQANVQSTHA